MRYVTLTLCYAMCFGLVGLIPALEWYRLSKCNVVIQPYYLDDTNRQSTKNELKAIADITEDIKKHPDTKCKILPLITCNTNDVKHDHTITDAYYRLHKTTGIGPQYDWLSRFSKEHGKYIELCLEQELKSRATKCIEKYGTVKEITDGCISHCLLDRDRSSLDLVTVFGVFHYPLPLFRMSKLQTFEEYRKLGFGRIVSKTWFCHTPINGAPCGLCNPCKSTVEAGMGCRLPPEALARYYKIRNKPIKSAFYRVKGRILRHIK